jgi:hypothetical protein
MKTKKPHPDVLALSAMLAFAKARYEGTSHAGAVSTMKKVQEIRRYSSRCTTSYYGRSGIKVRSRSTRGWDLGGR